MVLPFFANLCFAMPIWGQWNENSIGQGGGAEKAGACGGSFYGSLETCFPRKFILFLLEIGRLQPPQPPAPQYKIPTNELP